MMPEKTSENKKLPANEEKRRVQKIERGDESSWSVDQKKRGYYYDDDTNYKVYVPEDDDEEDESDDEK